MMSWYFLQHAPALAGGAGRMVLWGFAPGVRQGGAVSRWERRTLLCPGALRSTPLPCVLSKRKKPSWLDTSTTTTRSPCLSSETCASFQANDTIWYASGTVGQDNVFTRSSPQKKSYFYFSAMAFFCCCSLNTTMMRLWRDFIALGLKLITPARHPSIKEITKWHFVLGLCR